MGNYVFDNVAGAAVLRMASLAASFDAVTWRRLADVGVGAGWRCLEVGAGGGSVARWLAERVGPTGSVLATDINTRLIGDVPSNMDVAVHDIVADDLPDNEFDLVHARLVLIHLARRVEALERILRALKPGGYLVLDEFDCTWLPVLSSPDVGGPALFAKIVDAVHALLTEAGVDLRWGLHAYDAMRSAGFVELGYAGWSQLWVGGSLGIRVLEANVHETGERLLARGLVDTAEIEAFLKLVADPEFAVSSYPLLSTWGRKP
jgi:SAM-dependent methyltransferase